MCLIKYLRKDCFMMLMLVFLNCFKIYYYSFNFSRKISKERETELEKLFTENQENILDLQELKSSLSKSFEVKIFFILFYF